MARRSNSRNDSEQRVKVKPKLAKVSAVRFLQLQYPARVKYKGKVTGDWYEWAGAGSILPVAAEDAEDLLTKLMNRQPCCNSVNRPQPKFVEV